jgi:ribokinase
VTPLDTTAAGDTFCGVLAAGLVRGLDAAAALPRAAAAASLCVRRLGAIGAIPTGDETTAVLDAGS